MPSKNRRPSVTAHTNTNRRDINTVDMLGILGANSWEFYRLSVVNLRITGKISDAQFRQMMGAYTTGLGLGRTEISGVIPTGKRLEFPLRVPA